ncbi:MAG: Isoleucyl-tRNA synthetase [uncultured Gemmatimonadaceae bacterium]|uniref:Isoleucine--tRNA ligase n=1 Tax=uncultured Gemmatimonadaceae bacterium TaxID=246130 RepID=A0A6J4KE56_9BACT|nr:MAG: Isoleucyl-tRNA synthetase [uncultured Gemmatimonadaceae bacterium]
MSAAPAPAVRYRPLPPERPATELEDEMLARWAADGIFEQTLEARAGAGDFVFFEGPPTANGRPGIHHVFSRTIKDLVCRHRVMQGYRVARKAGWDTHGLPVEIEVEKQLGISGKQQIEALGVERFNALCRESVWRYRGEWERLSARIGYWLDYERPYVTYSNDYVESVWWALKTLHERDLLYRGHKILPYCPRCGTALSSHEVAQGYKDIKDPSVYLALDLVGDEPRVTSDEDGGVGGNAPPVTRHPSLRRRILVWTTTPWTLVSNAALAVNPELEYVELRKKSGADYTVLLAEARARAVLGDDYAQRWDEVGRVRGSELAGQRYRRPLDWLEYPEGAAHEVIVAESFVSAGDGTGVVHLAPAFGADDYAAGQRHGLAFLQPVNARGEFPADVPVVGGQFFKAADPLVVEELRARDVLWKATLEEHTYPHCWRCGTPLLYYARGSWFVRTTAYRDEMLARNAAVNWQPPEVGAGRFGEWLKNNIDWAVSRDRYWGTPLPVWVNDADATEVEVVGSYAELAERAGRALPADFDPHKPFIDAYTWPARSGTGTMRRVPEVIDTWFDSGSMPFAQWHFPFENADVVARQYPADFIAEGQDQTRGWFYSLLAIATGLGDALPNNASEGRTGSRLPAPSPSHAAGGAEGAGSRQPGVAAPYKAVIVNNLVLDAAGKKMSKSVGNTVDPWGVVERHGADAARLFLVAASQVWMERRFDEDAIRETAGRFLVTLKNTYTGIFAQYANFGWEPSAADPAVGDRAPLDRWVLSRLAAVESEADRLLTAYDAFAAARLVMTFFDEDVSKWYVRLSRARFYEIEGADNRAAFATLHEVLTVTCRLLAPFAPFVTDWLHRELAGASVHLADYARPAARTAGHADPRLERAMEHLRLLATLGRAAREEAGVKVRQPLSRLVCVVPIGEEREVGELVALLAGELNVKQVEFASSADSLVTLEAKANFRSLGKRFGKHMQLAKAAIEALSADALRAFERGEPVAVTAGDVTHELGPDDIQVLRRASGDLVVAQNGAYFAAIDPALTPALRREGAAREVVSAVQRQRKAADLLVSDRIRLWVGGDPDTESAVREHRQWICDETLAVALSVGETPGPEYHAAQAVEIDGATVRIALTKV